MPKLFPVELENSLQRTMQHNWTQDILQLSTMYFKEKKKWIKIMYMH